MDGQKILIKVGATIVAFVIVSCIIALCRKKKNNTKPDIENGGLNTNGFTHPCNVNQQAPQPWGHPQATYPQFVAQHQFTVQQHPTGVAQPQ